MRVREEDEEGSWKGCWGLAEESGRDDRPGVLYSNPKHARVYQAIFGIWKIMLAWPTSNQFSTF